MLPVICIYNSDACIALIILYDFYLKFWSIDYPKFSKKHFSNYIFQAIFSSDISNGKSFKTHIWSKLFF